LLPFRDVPIANSAPYTNLTKRLDFAWLPIAAFFLVQSNMGDKLLVIAIISPDAIALVTPDNALYFIAHRSQG
jgi:hypothetical protein